MRGARFSSSVAGTTPARRDTLRDSTLALRTFSLGGERVSECSPTYETPKLATFPRTSDDGRPMEEIGKRGRRRIVVFFTRNENRTRLPRDRRADFPNYTCREGRQKNAPASPSSVLGIGFLEENVSRIR